MQVWPNLYQKSDYVLHLRFGDNRCQNSQEIRTSSFSILRQFSYPKPRFKVRRKYKLVVYIGLRCINVKVHAGQNVFIGHEIRIYWFPRLTPERLTP
jgi:hypothetical protein